MCNVQQLQRSIFVTSKFSSSLIGFN